MSFGNLLQQLVDETTKTSLCHFAPELTICVTIILMLLMRLVSLDRWIPAYFIALTGSERFGSPWARAPAAVAA